MIQFNVLNISNVFECHVDFVWRGKSCDNSWALVELQVFWFLLVELKFVFWNTKLPLLPISIKTMRCTGNDNCSQLGHWVKDVSKLILWGVPGILDVLSYCKIVEIHAPSCCERIILTVKFVHSKGLCLQKYLIYFERLWLRIKLIH